MIAYVGDVNHLIGIMKVLRTPQATIQYEANPDKTEDVTVILRQNSEKLIEYLSHFLPERGRLYLLVVINR